MVQVSSIPAHLSSHTAARINEVMCGSRSSGENPMDSAGIAETTPRLSKSAAISMRPISQESEGCAALDGPATSSQGTARLPPPPTAVSGIVQQLYSSIFTERLRLIHSCRIPQTRHAEILENHMVEPSELKASDRPIEIRTASAQKGPYQDISAMNDHFPSMSQFCSPPRLHSLDSSFFTISHTNFRPKRETHVGVVQQRPSHEHTPITKLTARLKRFLTTDFERRLALR